MRHCFNAPELPRCRSFIETHLVDRALAVSEYRPWSDNRPAIHGGASAFGRTLTQPSGHVVVVLRSFGA